VRKSGVKKGGRLLVSDARRKILTEAEADRSMHGIVL